MKGVNAVRLETLPRSETVHVPGDGSSGTVERRALKDQERLKVTLGPGDLLFFEISIFRRDLKASK